MFVKVVARFHPGLSMYMAPKSPAKALAETSLNAIHGIILVGALLIAAPAQTPLEIVLGFVAVVLATINVVGGFVVTDRMLEMFKGRRPGGKARKEQ